MPENQEYVWFANHGYRVDVVNKRIWSQIERTEPARNSPYYTPMRWDSIQACGIRAQLAFNRLSAAVEEARKITED